MFGSAPVDVFAINVRACAEDDFNAEQAKTGGMPYGTYGDTDMPHNEEVSGAASSRPLD